MMLTLAFVGLDCYRLTDSLILNIDVVGGDFESVLTSTDICYYLSNFLIYVVLVYRVYFTFKNSVYAITKCQLTFLIFVLISDLCAIFIYVFYISTFFVRSSKDSTAETDTVLLVLGFDTVNDLIINITLLYLFLKKLYIIIFNLDMTSDIGYGGYENDVPDSPEIVSYNLSSFDETSNYELDEKQTNIVRLMTKTTLLTMVAAFFAQIWNVFAGVVEYRFATNELSQAELNSLAVVGLNIRDIEGVINCTVLYLMFTFNLNQYNACCGKCHASLYNNCLDQVQSNIVKTKKRTMTATVSQQEMGMKLLQLQTLD